MPELEHSIIGVVEPLNEAIVLVSRVFRSLAQVAVLLELSGFGVPRGDDVLAASKRRFNLNG